MKEHILRELTRIAHEHGVRILLAVESGSRAWGFASPDSDYDVRFIYACPRDWYLSVFETRDVIEEMLPDQLDVSGWDLRKTLRLFSKCNLALNEWLGSPIVYSEVPAFHARLASLIPDYFNPIAAIYHYRSMADRALAENLLDGQIRVKALFYVLRPLLACRWIERTQAQPPTEFAKLSMPEWVTPDEQWWIANLLKHKRRVVEAEPIAIETARADSIRRELAHYKSAAELVSAGERSGTSTLDQLYRDFVL